MRGVWCLSLLFGLSVFSGCFGGEDLEDFGEWMLPTWEPGHEWTWKVTYTGPFPMGTAYTPTIRHEVLRLDTMGGQPIYWIETDGHVEEPYHFSATTGGGYQAIRQHDLLPAGETHWFGYGNDGCTPQAFLVDTAPPVPIYSFPLTKGATWSDEAALQRSLTATTLGAEMVKTPAGTFQAVKIRLDIEGDEFEPAGTVDAWYAEEVRNLVRLEVPHDGIQIVLELQEFGLEEAAPKAAPLHQVLPDERSVTLPLSEKQYQIVSDAGFPLNRATNDTTVRFGVQEAPQRSYAPAQVAEVPELADLAPGQVLLWQLRDWDGTLVSSGEGPTWTVELPSGGAFEVAARKGYPRYEDAAASCHDWSSRGNQAPYEKTLARAPIAVGWTEAFAIDHPAGAEATYPLASIEVGPSATVMADYGTQQTGPNPDKGHLQVTLSDGTVEPLASNTTIDRAGAGWETWAFAWVAAGEGSFDTAGVTFGHRAAGTIEVRY